MNSLLILLFGRGEHIHHGYFLSPNDTKEKAHIQLIELLLERSSLPPGSTILDVGCGLGGTSRYLAKNHCCRAVGVTISGREVEIAEKLTLEETGGQDRTADRDSTVTLGEGSVRFVELDVEKMGDFFTVEANKVTFDCVWISEAMSHLPDKELFFRNTAILLNPGGKLVVADLVQSGWTNGIARGEGY
ncbi:hypothetical protein MMC25_004009 [Agyrium rufum]|nr:hypothetical protein [Agyrium rufum]